MHNIIVDTIDTLLQDFIGKRERERERTNERYERKYEERPTRAPQKPVETLMKSSSEGQFQYYFSSFEPRFFNNVIEPSTKSCSNMLNLTKLFQHYKYSIDLQIEMCLACL